MPSFYDRADIYDLFEDENRYNAYKKYWEAVLENKDIHSMLDVSIGSGSVTLPIMDLGVELSGSDLSETMLGNCQKKADSKQKKIGLQCSDFRDLSCWKDRKFDCVASTGNSLGYVCNEDVLKTLEQMDLLVKDGGYLYFDTRNWDKILKEKIDSIYIIRCTTVNIELMWFRCGTIIVMVRLHLIFCIHLRRIIRFFKKRYLRSVIIRLEKRC